ncbi:hypothetical protein EQ718_13430 [Paracoccus versutus]|uniref:Zn finger-like uncharacterized protein n=3 Tax=Paracoccus TaxID=265 RepID=A0AAQ0HK77_PARVE|nr:zinc-ribbon domain-containing protein [Paracoccus versutus]REG47694.1 putative Zn finger-like uncharacterized protein [Paracoccus versutus]WEJ79785.1 hypothetical protein EQ718_13430 [Paracoccus versutus]
MRLTCPRCAAQYEIAESAIPASGREVECSACGHVWRQPGTGKSAQAADPAPRRPYDPQARPVLNRPLDESVLAILREEAARELRAREAPARKPAPDHIPATAAATAAPEAAPATTEPAASDGRAPAEPPIDWPAATVTEPGIAPAPAETAPPETAPAEPAPASPQTPPEPQPQPESPVAETPAAKPAPPEWPEPVAPALPDAEELAATLTRSGPPLPDPAPEAGEVPPAIAPLIRPALPETPAAANPAEPAAAPAQREAPVPALVPVRRQRSGGYGMGFGLAAMLALGAVILYALAPQIPAEEGGGWLADWRQQVDQGRLWLHDRILSR